MTALRVSGEIERMWVGDSVVRWFGALMGFPTHRPTDPPTHLVPPSHCPTDVYPAVAARTTDRLPAATDAKTFIPVSANRPKASLPSYIVGAPCEWGKRGGSIAFRRMSLNT